MATTYGGKPAYKFRVGDNKTGQCSECGEVFYGDFAFDAHRRGPHDGERYCVDPRTGEVREEGRKPLTYWQGKCGRWHYGERRPEGTWAGRTESTLTAASSAEKSPGVG